ncbi:hypothetical protein SISNIDRAFT_472881 [Sistotremastrum niveocremeum HHB9708]|uniref:20S-pre-rRNA D-site endonuclease NOB1 n=1 Tax=Sistotremastrum niveocremeum HHB9708 TaxID=1314777 RepID=A0A164ZUK5_9AGAM|nr:hypothetical protein SISNIDRAFT_472881 [Sistotremastrum niveocremeum HHB9708]
MASVSAKPPVKNLVLDAGPLLSLAPLRGLAEHYVTVPQVIAELKDKKVREYFEKLALNGVNVEVRAADLLSYNKVTQAAKKTGDFSVLSQADIHVLALTCALNEEHKRQIESSERKDTEPLSTPNQQIPEDEYAPPEEVEESSEDSDSTPSESGTDSLLAKDQTATSDLSASLEMATIQDDIPTNEPNVTEADMAKEFPRENPDSASDDGEGEWITPSNVALHKSRALHLLPDTPSRPKAPVAQVEVGCMTADFAMQNVLLQMGLNLIDVQGKRIATVKSWVLRCHACFKLCKDMSKKFCPSCGNPTLLRTSVSVTSGKDGGPSQLKVHLKKNFQYKNRGTVYSIPSPKPGTSKTGPGEGLILREDQAEWMRAEKMDKGKRDREDKKLRQAVQNAKEGETAKVGLWMDPDWVPEMLSVGAGGKGRRGADGMPRIGHGRKNPNERRRKV